MKRVAREEWDKITSKLGASGFVAQYQIRIYHGFIILSSPQCRIIHFGGESELRLVARREEKSPGEIVDKQQRISDA